MPMSSNAKWTLQAAWWSQHRADYAGRLGSTSAKNDPARTIHEVAAPGEGTSKMGDQRFECHLSYTPKNLSCFDCESSYKPLGLHLRKWIGFARTMGTRKLIKKAPQYPCHDADCAPRQKESAGRNQRQTEKRQRIVFDGLEKPKINNHYCNPSTSHTS